MTETMQQPADMLSRLGRKWGWVLAYGIITLAAGVAVLVWPGETLLVIAVLFGIQLIVSGIFRFVAALAVDDLAGGTRVLLALLAVVSIIVGLWAVRHVDLTLLVLAALLGIFWVVNGAIELFTALSHRGMPERGWTAFMGVLSILAGIIVLAYPGLTLVTLAVILGIWLLIFGVMEIALVLAASLRPPLRRLAPAGQAGQLAEVPAGYLGGGYPQPGVPAVVDHAPAGVLVLGGHQALGLGQFGQPGLGVGGARDRADHDRLALDLDAVQLVVVLPRVDHRGHPGVALDVGPPLAAGQRVDPQERAVPDEPDRRDVRAARPEARQPAGPLLTEERVPLLRAHRDHPTAPLLSHRTLQGLTP